jgi:ATP-dependent DNA helicase RecG
MMEKENDITGKPVRYVKGIGPKIAVLLNQKGLKTIEDLFYFLPNRYEDKRTIKNIDEIVEGEAVLVVAKVVSSRPVFYPRARRRAFEANVQDHTGSLTLRWFHVVLPYLRELFMKDNILLLSGRVTRFGKNLQIVHPEAVLLEDEDELEGLQKIIPVYPEIVGMKQGTIRRIIKQAFDEYGKHLGSILPPALESSLGITLLREAIFKIHHPDEDVIDKEMHQVYVKRLIFEEYLLFQISLQMKKKSVKKAEGIRFKCNGKHRANFEKGLSFKLTNAQRKVIGEIEEDMGNKKPMNRLLQGDVGSGKTICAIAASCIAIDNGYQVAFMAPTEILAEQHYLTIHKFFDDMGIPMAYLRGNMGKERPPTIERIKAGHTLVVVGTHALLQGDIEFNNLGLVVIDEQHRFGVMQRKIMKQKGSLPDSLVMTATPIPRTLSMVVYGDLDVSVIDEMPAGRQKIWTKAFPDQEKNAVYKLIEDELRTGGQAFIVYPLVDESEKIELLNATNMAVLLQKTIFPDRKVGLLHGRMKADEKEKVMSLFKRKMIDVLVCTTVIEVGIDIPNATIIVIEHSERFGLSQLHQLRGRVGRGVKPSKCALITSEKKTAIAKQRIKVMEKTVDGFQIAEEDMRLRGPGEIFGLKQSGIPEFRLGNLVRDGDIMSRAKKTAEEILPKLSKDELDQIKGLVIRKWRDSLYLSDIA